MAIRGVLTGFNDAGDALVDFLNNPSGTAVPATTATPLDSTDIGREAVLVFEDGDPNRPILLGILRPPGIPEERLANVAISADGKRLSITADHEIVLRCGQASVTLTRAGKILIRGAYLLSRSSGVNRIKGGSVQIN
jgi:hypothetical protein